MNLNWKAFLDRLVPALIASVLALLGVPAVMSVKGCRSEPPPAPQPPSPPPKPPEPPKVDPVKAIGKIAMSGGYCSGTIVGPRRTDGRWNVVSASHCFKSVGENVTFITRDGLSLRATVVAIDRKCDGAILTLDSTDANLPFVSVALETPAPGSPIWHAGFGIDRPGNRESGQVLGGPDQNGQARYRLSVSPGDSGGGIMLDSNGNLLSPVCCTTDLAAVGTVWGASPENIRRMLAAPTEFMDLPPIAMPPPPTAMPSRK